MQSYDKEDLIWIIRRKLKRIHSHHIRSVVNILIDEIIQDIKNGIKVKIINFGVFKLIDYKSKMAPNVVLGGINQTKPSKRLRLKLARKLAKFIASLK